MTKILPEGLMICLPDRLCEEISDLKNIRSDDINELRIRLMRPASLTVSGINIPLSFRASPLEMNSCISKFCGGSVYAHGSSINEGYIEFLNGIRIGVSGRYIDGKVNSISSLNIRIPHSIRGISEYLITRFGLNERICSMLIYSRPGVGKTTLLRDLASKLSSEYNKRVTLIDTRGELYIPELFKDSICDLLCGYPRAKAIETATRTLSPEVIICDEIGDIDEANAILSAQNSGVPLIASAHAGKINELLSRPGIRLLHDSDIFSYYIGISRECIGEKPTRCFKFEEISRNDAEQQYIHISK